MRKTIIILLGILCVLFWRGFMPGYVVASNDGPYGAMHATRSDGYFSIWDDLNWIGMPAMGAPPASVSGVMRFLCNTWVIVRHGPRFPIVAIPATAAVFWLWMRPPRWSTPKIEAHEAKTFAWAAAVAAVVGIAVAGMNHVLQTIF